MFTISTTSEAPVQGGRADNLPFKKIKNEEGFCKKCNQDVDVSIVEKSNQHTAYCTICGCYIKNIPYSTKNRAKYLII